MKRILFICMGNICRSPAAEIVFRKMVEDAGLDDRFEIDSAGTIGYHEGNPPDSRMCSHLEARGYEISGRSRPLRESDLGHYDLLLTMDEENLADTLRLDRNGDFGGRIKPFVDYLSEHEAERIPDPYYGGDAGFAHVIDLMEDGCRNLLTELSET
ncbi:MAG: low molecular weight phosphotyrosine protein phosphatase [Akkermansiaceae bacterium]|jgi:protein-tyrosine phosphatase|nr:low molecular weight phosphotyrosine protein phosphatase [Akkermansiaceae bacterium]MDP4645603.1 low molecular weight phosphotyrosine protein phosphatase [Akkermansiaceae bacterium]MDP4719966.1 low molecular weight phosphotyrosine protein phosphatase [Akkermansiaceae bacterium]MDP4780827.1 low molecular weight phosphotyrosine protein phosphatase [Akkermansiaceae bacterium]MDP4848401.1 low molecular weight phosphotyrosine protein phosphatase [Akkermansiaceae bacterium]